MTEAQQNRLLKKIDRFKQAMRREKKQWGGYHDGHGHRYTIAELYFELGDPKKTNRYISWFDKTFPDDGTYSYFEFGVAHARFQLGKLVDCKQNIVAVVKNNTYLLDLLIENNPIDQNKHELQEHETLDWAHHHLDHYKVFLNSEFKIWLTDFCNSTDFRKWYRKYVSILKLLKDTDSSEERSSLFNASWDCIKEWKAEIESKR